MEEVFFCVFFFLFLLLIKIIILGCGTRQTVLVSSVTKQKVCTVGWFWFSFWSLLFPKKRTYKVSTCLNYRFIQDKSSVGLYLIIVVRKVGSELWWSKDDDGITSIGSQPKTKKGTEEDEPPHLRHVRTALSTLLRHIRYLLSEIIDHWGGMMM